MGSLSAAAPSRNDLILISVPQKSFAKYVQAIIAWMLSMTVHTAAKVHMRRCRSAFFSFNLLIFFFLLISLHSFPVQSSL